jgi:hypothetical protein
MSKEDSNGNSGCGCLLLIILFLFIIPMCDKQNKKMKILEKKVEQLEKKNIPAEQPEKPWKKGNE